MVMQIVKAEIEGDKGVVIIEGDNAEELLSARARALAYAERIKMGLSSAGLEDREFGPVDASDDPNEKVAADAERKFRKVFHLNPMLV